MIAVASIAAVIILYFTYNKLGLGKYITIDETVTSAKQHYVRVKTKSFKLYNKPAFDTTEANAILIRDSIIGNILVDSQKGNWLKTGDFWILKTDVEIIPDTITPTGVTNILPDSMIVKDVNCHRALIKTDTMQFFSIPLATDTAVSMLRFNKNPPYIYIDSQIGDWYKTGDYWAHNSQVEPINDSIVIEKKLISERSYFQSNDLDIDRYPPILSYNNDYAEPRYDRIHTYSKPILSNKYLIRSLPSADLRYCIINIEEQRRDWVKTTAGEWIEKKELNFLADTLSPYLHIGEITPDSFCHMFSGPARPASDYIPIYPSESLDAITFLSPSYTAVTIFGKNKRDIVEEGSYGAHHIILKVRLESDTRSVIGWMKASDLLFTHNKSFSEFDTTWSPTGFRYSESGGCYVVSERYWLSVKGNYYPIGTGMGTWYGPCEFWFSPDHQYLIATGKLDGTTAATKCIDSSGHTIFLSAQNLGTPSFYNNMIYLRGCNEDDNAYYVNLQDKIIKKLLTLPNKYNVLEVVPQEPECASPQWYPTIQIDSTNKLLHIRYVRMGSKELDNTADKQLFIDVVADTNGVIQKITHTIAVHNEPWED